MNILKSKKAFITILFASTIIFSNSLPLYALEINSKNEIAVEKSDSTKIKASISQTQNQADEVREIQKSKTTSNFTYNIIFYLISKFIKTNPLNRHR